MLGSRMEVEPQNESENMLWDVSGCLTMVLRKFNEISAAEGMRLSNENFVTKTKNFLRFVMQELDKLLSEQQSFLRIFKFRILFAHANSSPIIPKNLSLASSNFVHKARQSKGNAKPYKHRRKYSSTTNATSVT